MAKGPALRRGSVVTALGVHSRQQGSLVENGRLCFSFVHFTILTPDQLTAIETPVNTHVLDDPAVSDWYATRAEAEAAGAIALFGEKHGETRPRGTSVQRLSVRTIMVRV
ncbi:hypothetical protein [Streptomyces sp. enrichment culture]|uniref:hypothetical protein n=1 Tax=Streptomyces sp. enrichment culture TaxID=1795815 RepID=UPI003F57C1AF